MIQPPDYKLGSKTQSKTGECVKTGKLYVQLCHSALIILGIFATLCNELHPFRASTKGKVRCKRKYALSLFNFQCAYGNLIFACSQQLDNTH